MTTPLFHPKNDAERAAIVAEIVRVDREWMKLYGTVSYPDFVNAHFPHPLPAKDTRVLRTIALEVARTAEWNESDQRFLVRSAGGRVIAKYISAADLVVWQIAATTKHDAKHAECMALKADPYLPTPAPKMFTLTRDDWNDIFTAYLIHSASGGVDLTAARDQIVAVITDAGFVLVPLIEKLEQE